MARSVFFLPSPFGSSTAHRNASRANALAQIIGGAVQELTPSLVIPQTLAQTLVSCYSIFRPDTHIHEKVVHSMQSLLALGQLVLTIYLLFSQNSDCKSEDETQVTACLAMTVLQLLYKGTLTVSWAISESSKDPYEPQAPRSVEDPPPPPPAANPEPPAEAPALPPDVVTHAQTKRRKIRVRRLEVGSADTSNNDDVDDDVRRAVPGQFGT